MKKSLLFISYYFPPIKSIAVKRNYYLANGLREFFEEVQVFTTSNYKILEEENFPIDGLNVKHLNTFDYRTILAKFRKKKSTHFSEGHKKSWILSRMIKLNETFPFNIIFGEGGFLYILDGYLSGRKYLSTQKEKYIITSYRPAANVYIGYLLKKTFSDAKWIVNFHDFPVDTIRANVLFPSFQRWIWAKLLKNTFHNIAVSKGVENHIKKLSPNVSTIMNGVEIRLASVFSNNKFRLVYTGSLYQDLSNPNLLFKCLTLLIKEGQISEGDIEIIYAGKDSDYWMSMILENGLEKIAKDLGEISSKEAMVIQATANINILLTWASTAQSGVITGKFYEYLGCCKPILAIINGVKDEEFYQLFQQLNCGLSIATEDKDCELQLKNFMLHHYNAWKNKTSIPSYSGNLKSFTWGNQIKKLAKIMIGE